MTQTTVDRANAQQSVPNDGRVAGSELTTRVVSGGSLAEAVAGLGAVVLCILGFNDLAPERLGAIAVIAIGGGFLVRGAAVAARASAVMARSHSEEQLASGVSAELLAGVAGVALGVLAFLDVERAVLLPAALIAFGAALMMGAAMTRQLDTALGGLSSTASPVLQSDLGAEVLIGLGAIALGIIALVSTPFNVTLVLAGLTAVGAGMTLEAIPGLVRVFGVGR